MKQNPICAVGTYLRYILTAAGIYYNKILMRVFAHLQKTYPNITQISKKIQDKLREVSVMLYSYPDNYAESNHYTVKVRDTLYTISKFYNISLDALVESNPDIDPANIVPGQSIFIPLTTADANCPTGARAYTIQKGDDFYSIARSFKIHLSALIKANPGINPDALLIGQRLCIPTISSIYTSETYRVSLAYPYLWSKVDNERYEGIDGFFQISAVSGAGSLEEVCKMEAYHKLKPYGTHPNITYSGSDYPESCMIIPSEDQLHEMRGQSALVVRYPEPVEIKGKSCEYLVIWTNKNHIKDIADTLELLDAEYDRHAAYAARAGCYL